MNTKTEYITQGRFSKDRDFFDMSVPLKTIKQARDSENAAHEELLRLQKTYGNDHKPEVRTLVRRTTVIVIDVPVNLSFHEGLNEN